MKEVDIVIATSGAGFADDAVPFHDLKEDEELPFVERNGAVYLRGSRCGSSGSLAFPARRVCLETGARDMEPLLFGPRSEEHTSELQSLMRISYAVFCLKQKNRNTTTH